MIQNVPRRLIADVRISIVYVRKTCGEMLVARLPPVVNILVEMEVASDRSDTWQVVGLREKFST